MNNIAVIYTQLKHSHNDQLPVGLTSLVDWLTAPVSQRSWVRIPFKPNFFSGLLFKLRI